MEINIAKTTDKEIQDIIDTLVKNENYTQEDEGCVRIKTPYEVHQGFKTEEANKTIFLVLYPELLSYYDGKNWVSIPWICMRIELEGGSFGESENNQRVICKWLVEEMDSMDIKLFKDEDSFEGHFSRDQRKGWVKLKMYTNPSFPKGFWSNHAL